MAREDDDRRRRSSYFPNVAMNKGYSLNSRFTGGLQPSPTGSYYNPSRYSGQGFSTAELNRIQGSLATNYMKDLEFNRIANPNYQTIQDTGYSSTAPFGSGRASPATVQNYALQYGTPTGNGLSTFTTPSGGSITYRPSGRRLSGGLSGGGATPNSAVPVSPTLQQFNLSQAYQQGYGAPSPSVQQGPGGQYMVQGGVAAPYSPPGIGQQISGGLRGVGTFASNLAGNVRSFFPGANQAIVQRASNPTMGQAFGDARNALAYAGRAPTPYRRYFD